MPRFQPSELLSARFEKRVVCARRRQQTYLHGVFESRFRIKRDLLFLLAAKTQNEFNFSAVVKDLFETLPGGGRTRGGVL